jgi:hypothetical protein
LDCYDTQVFERPAGIVKVSNTYDLQALYTRIAEDSGLPIYQKLVAGPQAKKERLKRPLHGGKEADVYEATLLAIAETGPKPSISYEEIRTKLNAILKEKVPQKHEVTSALKHLSRISAEGNADQGIDWDDTRRMLHIPDPYLRFYLRWQVRKLNEPGLTLAIE